MPIETNYMAPLLCRYDASGAEGLTVLWQHSCAVELLALGRVLLASGPDGKVMCARPSMQSSPLSIRRAQSMHHVQVTLHTAQGSLLLEFALGDDRALAAAAFNADGDAAAVAGRQGLCIVYYDHSLGTWEHVDRPMVSSIDRRLHYLHVSMETST